MQSLNNGLGEAQILFILVTHESNAKGRAKGEGPIPSAGKGVPGFPDRG